MSCILYFEITNSPSSSFLKEKMVWLRELIPQLAMFDFDNHSDALLKNYAMKLIQENVQKVLYLDILDEESVKGTLPFMERMLSGSSKLVLICSKHNVFIDVIAGQYNISQKIAESRNDIAESLRDYIKGGVRL